MTNIQQFRHIVQMTQKQFSEEFGIPIGTLRNWEQGVSNPPDYVYSMILSTLRRDYMINLETLKLLGIIKQLAEYSKSDISDFSEATQENYDEKLFYDGKSGSETEGYRIVCDACILDNPECIHHDIVSYWDSINNNNEYTIRVFINKEENKYYIEVKFKKSEASIIIENGDWYFSCY